LVEALQKLCHDLLAVRSGAAPRFFEPADLPPPASVEALTGWWRSLAATSRTVDHPFNAGLMLEDLVSQARAALHSRSHP
jgi:DNA polymerase III subunit delta'